MLLTYRNLIFFKGFCESVDQTDSHQVQQMVDYRFLAPVEVDRYQAHLETVEQDD